MTQVRRVYIEEQPGTGRLGRHVEHDERSRAFAYGAKVVALNGLRTVRHRRWGGAFDQGDLGSCTGNAAAGSINTVPLHRMPSRLLTERDAVDLYSRATVLDGFEGEYPPEDTGSSGLSAAKAALEKGYIVAYRHAFSVEEALSALVAGPVITGVNWYEGFDRPDERGLVEISGQIRGGHEFEVLALELGDTIDSCLVVAENSWGRDWGVRGRFHFTVATWRQLLNEDGDVTILMP